MDLSLPPNDVPAARLFRLLLGRPRPVIPLDFRFPFAPDLALAVRGLTALEDAEVVDVDRTLPAESIQNTIQRRVVTATLLANGRPAFAAADDVDALTEAEFAVLSSHVFRAAHTISPMRRSVNIQAWRDRLVEGAKHRSNISAASTVFMSTQTLVGPRSFIHEHAPDRYFGLPLADLTDGQLMAYAAAVAVFDKA